MKDFIKKKIRFVVCKVKKEILSRKIRPVLKS